MKYTSFVTMSLALTTIMAFMLSVSHHSLGILLSTLLLHTHLASTYAVPPLRPAVDDLEERWTKVTPRQATKIDDSSTDRPSATIDPNNEPIPTKPVLAKGTSDATATTKLTPIPTASPAGRQPNTTPKGNFTTPDHCPHHSVKPKPLRPGKSTMFFSRHYTNGTNPGHGKECHHINKPPKPGHPGIPQNGTQPILPGKGCNTMGGGNKDGIDKGKCGNQGAGKGKDSGKGKGKDEGQDKNTNKGKAKDLDMSMDKDNDSGKAKDSIQKQKKPGDMKANDLKIAKKSDAKAGASVKANNTASADQTDSGNAAKKSKNAMDDSASSEPMADRPEREMVMDTDTEEVGVALKSMTEVGSSV